METLNKQKSSFGETNECFFRKCFAYETLKPSTFFLQKYTGLFLVFSLLILFSFLISPGAFAQPTPKKWFPGHYLMASENDFNRTSGGWTNLRGANGYLFEGIWLYVTWGEIETGLNTYSWDKIDGMLNALPAGKKLGLSLAWQEWNAKIPPCPADMIDDKNTGLYRGGYIGTGTRYSTFWLNSTMDRYLNFLQKFAERYDTCRRLAFVVTGELSGTAYRNGPGYDANTCLANLMRLPDFIAYFKHTPSGMLGDWWPYLGSMSTFIQKTVAAGGGFGGPDIHVDGTSLSGYILSNAGKQPNWQGMEWMDLKEFAALPFPKAQLDVSTAWKTNFIWWNTNNRSNETPPGHNFNTEVINFLKANPGYGISKACPGNIICEETVSTQTIEAGFAVNIFPNPVAEVLKITTGVENAKISIFNLSGTEVFCQTITESNLEINVKGFPSGMYIIMIRNDQNQVVRKFTKV